MATTAFGFAVPPSWFKAAAFVGLVWNAFGVAMYLSSVGVFGDPLEGLTAAERAVAANIPAGITAAFAIGTVGGLIGCLGLVLGRRWARPALFISLFALLVLEGWIVFLSGALEFFGLAVPLSVVAGAVLLAWLAQKASGSNWLR